MGWMTGRAPVHRDKALPGGGGGLCISMRSGRTSTSTTAEQGLTLVQFSAQLEGFHGIGGARRGCVAHVKGVLGGV